MLKNHLVGGVRKGALTEEQAEAKFNAWVEEKTGKVDAKLADLSKAEEKAKADAFAAEKAVNEARIAAAQPVVVADAEDAPGGVEAAAAGDSEE